MSYKKTSEKKVKKNTFWAKSLSNTHRTATYFCTVVYLVSYTLEKIKYSPSLDLLFMSQ